GIKSIKTTVVLAAAGLLASQVIAFTPQNATYSGLFFETNGVWQQSSGVLTLKTTARGTYSGKLTVGANRYSVSGTFDQNGRTTRGVPRRSDSTLVLDLQVDATDADLLTGTVSDGTWTADLIADRGVFDGKRSLSPDAGQYTILIPGDFTSTDTPGGDGAG